MGFDLSFSSQPKRLIFWTLCIIGFLITPLLTFSQNDFEPINVNAAQEMQPINDEVYLLTDFELKSTVLEEVRAEIRLKARRNKNKYSTFLAKSFEKKHGWFYFEVANPSTRNAKLTLSTNSIKCDALTYYKVGKEGISANAKIERATPLTERAYPSFLYAVPISVAAMDTLGILVKSERSHGFNEVELFLSSEENFKERIFPRLFKEIFLIVYGIVSSLFLTFFGFVYKNNLLKSIGIYLFSVSLAFIVLFSYQDTWTYPSWLAVNASRLTQSAPTLANVTIFYFLYQLSRRYELKFNKWFIKIYWIIGGWNVLNLFIQVFLEGWNQYLTTSLRVLSTVVIILAAIEVLKFTYKTRRYYFLLALVVGLGIGLGQAVYIQYMEADAPFNPLINFTLAPFAIILLGFSGLMEARYELTSEETSKRKLQDSLKEVDLINKQEIEKIGRNLHDNIANTLAASYAYLNLKDLKVEKIKSLIASAIQEVRFASHNIIRYEKEPINERLQSLVDRFDELSSIRFSFKNNANDNLINLSEFRQKNLYHIVQESFNNAFKHSTASEVTLQIFKSDSSITCIIEDDGVGISQSNSNKGIGIINSKKRAELSDFIFHIDSSDSGTSIIIEINQNE